MTGRHPVRTGLLKAQATCSTDPACQRAPLVQVLWPGQTDGLSPEEFTLAEAKELGVVADVLGPFERRSPRPVTILSLVRCCRRRFFPPLEYAEAMWGKWRLGCTEPVMSRDAVKASLVPWML